MPLKRRIRGLLLVQGFMYLRAFAPAMVATTRIACPIIHRINCRLCKSASSWSRLCAGSPMAPNIAISTAPPQTKTVPPKDHRVKGSPRMRVAHRELKTRPDCKAVSRHFETEEIFLIIQLARLTRPEAAVWWFVSCFRQYSQRWTWAYQACTKESATCPTLEGVLVRRTCHLRRLCGGRRGSFGSFSSSNMWDFRCNVRPKDWTEVEMSPTKIPI